MHLIKANGERLVPSVFVFNGSRFLEIRTYRQKSVAECKWKLSSSTKKAITVPLEQLDELIDLLVSIKDNQ